MTFQKHYSSSTGNLYTVTAANGKRLLIDPGVTWKRLQKALNFKLGGIEAALISHEHLDHCKAVKDVMRNGIDCYSSAGTWRALDMAEARRAKIIESGVKVKLDSFHVLPFKISHGDSPEPLGFVVREVETCEYLLFVTDFFCLEQEFAIQLNGERQLIPFSIIAIACNFNGDLLRAAVDAGTIHEKVAKRIVNSHPSQYAVKLYLDEHCNLDKIREIHLLHMSGSNIDKASAREYVGEGLFCDVL
jgi:hypothetical protein